jgi:hypothetical protein
MKPASVELCVAVKVFKVHAEWIKRLINNCKIHTGQPDALTLREYTLPVKTSQYVYLFTVHSNHGFLANSNSIPFQQMQIRFNAFCTLVHLIIETGQLSWCTPYSSRAQASVNPEYISKRSNISMENKHAWSLRRSEFISENSKNSVFCGVFSC